VTATEDAPKPADWPVAKIGELFDSWGGHTPSKANAAYWGDGLPWVSSRDVKSSRLATTTHCVTMQAVEETGLRVCPVGSVLVVVRSGVLAHTLPVAVTEVPVTINQDLKAFYSDEPYLNEWLALFLHMSAQALLTASRRDGTTVQSVKYPLLKDTEIPVPPMSERRAIIEVVEILLAKQTTILPLLLSASQTAQQIRRAVLAAACRGRLTAEWRKSNDPSPVSGVLAELRGSNERATYRHDGVLVPDPGVLGPLPTRWAWAVIGEVAEVQLGGTPARNNLSFWNGGIPWVSSGEVANCRIATTRETISAAGLAGSNAKLYPPGTVLIAMIGEGKTRGQAAILGIEAASNQNAAGILPNRDILDPEYLWRWALAQYEVTRAIGRGGNQAALNAQKVRELVIPMPPMDEQREIVRRVDAYLEVAASILERVRTASGQVERSSQAILDKAVRGELASADDVNGSAERIP
jgi:type I restriction enzyme, S subunit